MLNSLVMQVLFFYRLVLVMRCEINQLDECLLRILDTVCVDKSLFFSKFALDSKFCSKLFVVIVRESRCVSNGDLSGIFPERKCSQGCWEISIPPSAMHAF